MNAIMHQLQKLGLVPVVVLEDVENALPLAQCLVSGGLPCAEITFRTPSAAEALRRMASAFPQLLLGAGTVLTCEQADRAMDAGAKFIVSPGLQPTVTEHVLQKGLPMVPGVCTPSEMEAALSFGLDVVKFFPAEPSGGLSMLRALAAPYAGVRFMPTGGIHVGNVRPYLENERVLACGGSWMVDSRLIREGCFDRIETLVREAAAIVREIRGDGACQESERQ